MALVGQGAEIVKEELRARAPVLSGRLRDSIDVVEQEDSIEESSASVGATVEYDRYYQFGTSKMPARPYSEDAADAAGDGVLRLAVSLFGRI
jgi:HK97 gp10 family phage protein